ncbi:MAG: response regulator [FCB group bacterium]|nr:response regulator [FCB group bacterium]
MYKVLFVDDEIQFLENVELLFEGDTELEVMVISKPELVMMKVSAQKPDIIFLDVSMPKMDGGEVAIALQDNPSTQHIPIVFLTAIIGDRERGSHGGKLFIPNPVRAAEIREIIHDLLD